MPGRDPHDDDDVITVDTRGRVPVRNRRPVERPGSAPERRRRGVSEQPRAEGTRGPRAEGTRSPRAEGTRGPRAEGTRSPRLRATHRRRRILVVGVVLVLAWLTFMVWVPFQAWGKVQRIDASPGGTRPADSEGHDYVLVGSDSRQGLTPAQARALHTGSARIGGKRTDSIILVHVPSGEGKPALISLPRDSYVPIPGHDKNKINAAYSLGGPKLLVATIEAVTDVRIDGYVEIGFGGFASVVDSLDGVDICVKRAMDDPKAGINLKAGCQSLNGPNALGFVRARYSDPLGDIGRAQRQRQFLGAIMKKAASPSTALIPWRYYGFANAAGAGLTVGDGTSLRDVTRVLQAMRAVSNGDGLSLTVPISNAALPTHVGSAVKWDSPKARALFKAIKEDQPLTVAPSGSGG